MLEAFASGGRHHVRDVMSFSIASASSFFSQALHAAKSLDGLGKLRILGLHKLSGDRSGSWAMTINGPWRLVFRFKDGDAHDVEIVDYH
jgi:plasmid maintenance system killer protein